MYNNKRILFRIQVVRYVARKRSAVIYSQSTENKQNSFLPFPIRSYIPISVMSFVYI